MCYKEKRYTRYCVRQTKTELMTVIFILLLFLCIFILKLREEPPLRTNKNAPPGFERVKIKLKKIIFPFPFLFLFLFVV
jgi:hypothetical protein